MKAKRRHNGNPRYRMFEGWITWHLLRHRLKIRLVETIDESSARSSTRGDAGRSVLARALNGLGFVSHPLYLTSAIFETSHGSPDPGRAD